MAHEFYRARKVLPLVPLLTAPLFALGVGLEIGVLTALLLCGGILLRIWASAYIGEVAWDAEIVTGPRVCGGPYRFLQHPLYVANTLLTFSCVIATGNRTFLLIACFVILLLYVSLARMETRAWRAAGTARNATQLPVLVEAGKVHTWAEWWRALLRESVTVVTTVAVYLATIATEGARVPA